MEASFDCHLAVANDGALAWYQTEEGPAEIAMARLLQRLIYAEPTLWRGITHGLAGVGPGQYTALRASLTMMRTLVQRRRWLASAFTTMTLLEPFAQSQSAQDIWVTAARRKIWLQSRGYKDDVLLDQAITQAAGQTVTGRLAKEQRERVQRATAISWLEPNMPELLLSLVQPPISWGAPGDYSMFVPMYMRPAVAP